MFNIFCPDKIHLSAMNLIKTSKAITQILSVLTSDLQKQNKKKSFNILTVRSL